MKRKSTLSKFLALSISALIAVSVFTSCGQAGSSISSGSASSATSVSSVFNDGPLEPYADPVTIRVGRSFAHNHVFRGEETVDDNMWTSAYKDMLNIEIENMWVVDPSQAATKMSSAIASGDYPDIFTVNATDYAKYAASGVIADVTDLYEKYLSENGKTAVNADNGYSLDAMTIDGKLYGIPIVDNPLDSLNQLWIRKDWLDAVGLDEPETIDDVLEIAKAFVEQDPDGNGQADTYAFAFDCKNI